ncbi:MAG TPA: hypothetical protein VIG41_12345 [Micrococcaceae bacterium]
MEIRSIDERDMHDIRSHSAFRVIDWWRTEGTEYRERSHAFEINDASLSDVLDWVRDGRRSTCDLSEIYCVAPDSFMPRESIFVLMETADRGGDLPEKSA